MIKYRHGSDDSVDIDIFYVFDSMPDLNKCKELCNDKTENRNIITIENGYVNNCFKGTVDEVNNSLLRTYNLHHQIYPLYITNTLPRDILIKDLRVLRGLISYLSRTKYRELVKSALRGWFSDRLNALKDINFNVLLEDDLHKTFTLDDILKVYAFQLGQSIGLHEGVELYTKKEISNKYPKLKPFLYRENNINLEDLIYYINIFIDILNQYDVIEYKNNITYFEKPYHRFIDMKTEKEIYFHVE